MLCFYFVAQCHDGFVKCVSSDRLCKSVVFASPVFLLFSFEVISSAFVLPFAAVLIVEAFVFVFCLHHETRRCVVYWFLFWSAAVSLRCFYWAVFERRAVFFITSHVF